MTQHTKEEKSCLRFRITVRKHNRIIIPKDICEKLGIKEGTFLEGDIYGENKILLEIIAK